MKNTRRSVLLAYVAWSVARGLLDRADAFRETLYPYLDVEGKLPASEISGVRCDLFGLSLSDPAAVREKGARHLARATGVAICDAVLFQFRTPKEPWLMRALTLASRGGRRYELTQSFDPPARIESMDTLHLRVPMRWEIRKVGSDVRWAPVGALARIPRRKDDWDFPW